MSLSATQLLEIRKAISEQKRNDLRKLMSEQKRNDPSKVTFRDNNYSRWKGAVEGRLATQGTVIAIQGDRSPIHLAREKLAKLRTEEKAEYIVDAERDLAAMIRRSRMAEVTIFNAISESMSFLATTHIQGEHSGDAWFLWRRISTHSEW